MSPDGSLDKDIDLSFKSLKVMFSIHYLFCVTLGGFLKNHILYSGYPILNVSYSRVWFQIVDIRWIPQKSYF